MIIACKVYRYPFTIPRITSIKPNHFPCIDKYQFSLCLAMIYSLEKNHLKEKIAREKHEREFVK